MFPAKFRVTSAAAVLAAFALTSFALTGCGNSSNSSNSGGPSGVTRLETPDITIAAVPSADLAGIYVAQDDGFFARQGLHVKLVKIAASKAIVAAQLAGRVDLCAGAYMPYIAAEAAGDKFSVLAEGSIMTPGTRSILVPGDSTLTGIGQLAGKTIGMNATNSIGTLLVSAALEENGVSPSDVHFVTDTHGFPTMAKELAGHAWDAAFFGQPFLAQAQEEYGESSIIDLDRGALIGLPISGYIATKKWTDQHPRTARAFVNAIEAAQLAIDENPNLARAALGKSDDLPGVVTGVMSIPDFPTGVVDVTRLQREALDMLQFGFLNEKYAPEVRNGSLVRTMVAGAP